MSTTMLPMPQTLSVVEAAEMLSISRNSAYAAVARGEIPSVRVGKLIRVPTQRLLAMLDGEGGEAG